MTQRKTPRQGRGLLKEGGQGRLTRTVTAGRQGAGGCEHLGEAAGTAGAKTLGPGALGVLEDPGQAASFGAEAGGAQCKMKMPDTFQNYEEF